MRIRNTDEESKELRTIIVLLQDDAPTGTNLRKIRLHVSFSPFEHQGNRITSEILRQLIHRNRKDHHDDEATTMILPAPEKQTDYSPPDAIEVYDTHSNSFISLQSQENVVDKLGTRLRCILVGRKPWQLQPLFDAENEITKFPAIAGRYFSYNNHGLILTNKLHLQASELPNMTGSGTGFNVWDGAILLVKYLELHPEVIRGNMVLELGAGCGVVGIAACLLGATRVILTDLPYAMDLMKSNVAKNPACEGVADCRVCDWRQPPIFDELWKSNLLLIADCVWIDELVEPLLNTISTFLDASQGMVTAVVAYQERGNSTYRVFWPRMIQLFDHVEKADFCIDKPANLEIYVCRATRPINVL